LTYSTKSNNSF